jgi:hypothetical protein
LSSAPYYFNKKRLKSPIQSWNIFCVLLWKTLNQENQMKGKIAIQIVLIVLFLSVFAFSSVLSDIANGMEPGTWAMMPENASFDNLDMPYSLFYYNDSGCWDPINKRIRWIGAGGTCCTNGQYYLMTYTESDNTWTIENAPFIKSGHGFDGNAMDPATGIHYFYLFHEAGIRTLDGSTWSTLPDIPFTASASNAPSWFPDINNGNGGLVHVGASGNSAWFDGSNWNTIPKPAQAWGDRAMFSQYNPVHKFVWLGGGPNNLRVHYKLDAQLNLTRFKDAPLDMRMSKTLHSVDPVSGMCIVCTTGGAEWWEFNPVTDTWTPLANTQGAPQGSIAMQVPIPDYGVILYVRHYVRQRDVYIYKHAAPSAVSSKPVKAAGAALAVTATPNPFKTTVKIAASGQRIADSNIGVAIYDIKGKMVHKLSATSYQLSAGISWNASGLPAGVYLLKVTAGNKTVSRRLFLQR